MVPFPRRLSDLLVRQRWALLSLSVVLTLLSLWPATRLSFDQSIESVFPDSDPRLVSYRQLQRTFGGNEIVLAAYRDEALFAANGSGIERAEAVRQRLERVAGVKSVLSIDRPLGKAIIQADPIATRIRDLFAGYTHSWDGQTAAMVCMLMPMGETTVPRHEVISELRKVMHEELPDGLAPGMIAGEPVMVSDGYGYLAEDGRRLGWATTLLLALVIILCFRSFRWVIVPIAIVQTALLWTKALLVASQLELSMVSSMLAAVITVVGVATVVHFIVRFRDARSDGLPVREALLRAMGILLVPIAWACATDAAGFGSLLVTNVGPVQDFGVMMSLGALLVIVSVALNLPALALAGSIANDPQKAWGEGLLEQHLQRLVQWVERHPWQVGGTAICVTLFCAIGAVQLKVESDFTKNFRRDSQIVQSYQFVESQFGGAGVWDVMLPAPKTLDYEYLYRVHQLEQHLQKEVRSHDLAGSAERGLTKTMSLAAAIDATRPGMLDTITVNGPILLLGEERAREAIRQKRDLEIGIALNAMRQRIPVFFGALHAEDPDQPGRYWLRIMLRSREQQPSHAKRQIIAAVERIVQEQFPPALDSHKRQPQVTGIFVLLTFIIDSLLADQWLAFAIACAGIGLMMCAAFRSPVYALVALAPNVLPIVIVTGLMGWLGMKINMGAAMIAAVSMGLSIDSSIHYVISFQRARRDGSAVHEALGMVQKRVGRAMVFSTLALIAGFAVLCFSQFVPTVYFGVLVSLTMLGGLLGNLIVLPLLLQLATQRVNPATMR